ncbi:MAG: RQC domain-containing protein, partial [Planctomycetota bacterium]
GSALRLLGEAGLAQGLTADPQAAVTLTRPGAEILDKLRGPVQQRTLEGLSVAVDLERPGRYAVSLSQVAQAAGLSEPQVRRSLAALDREGHLAYEPPFRGRGVEKLVDDPPPFDEVPIDWDRHAFLRGLEEEKLEAMEDYIRTPQCRRAHIVRYFGEPTDLACGVCDRCKRQEAQAETGGVLADEPVPARAVLACIRDLRFPLGANKVAQVVTGSRAAAIRKHGLDRNPAYGVLALKKDRVRKVIDDLLKEGYLTDEPGQYGPTLHLTRRGQEVADATEVDELEEFEEPETPASPHPKPSAVARVPSMDDAATRRAALTCVAELTTPVGVGKVAGVITGSGAEWVSRLGADRLACYNAVGLTQKQAQEAVKGLIGDGYLSLDRRTRYPVLALTDLGREELARLQAKTPAADPYAASPEPQALSAEPPPEREPRRRRESRPDKGLARALDAMLGKLLSGDREQARALVQRLRLFHPAEIARRLEQAYEDADGVRARSRAVWAAGELCGEAGLAFLNRCAGAEDANVRRLAASALGKAAAAIADRDRARDEHLARTREILAFLRNDTAPQVRQDADKALQRLEDSTPSPDESGQG